MFCEFQGWKFWIFSALQCFVMSRTGYAVSQEKSELSNPLSRARIAILCFVWNSKGFRYSCLISMNKAHLSRYIFYVMYALGGCVCILLPSETMETPHAVSYETGVFMH